MLLPLRYKHRAMLNSKIAQSLARRLSKSCFVLLMLFMGLVPLAHALEVPFASPEEWFRWQSRTRLSMGETVTLASPHFSILGNSDAQLLLMNRFSEVIDFTVTVVDHRGEEFPVEVISLRSREVAEIDLRGTVKRVAPHLAEGSLFVSYFGDAAMAQGWIVQGRARSWNAIALKTISELESEPLITIWDRQLVSDPAFVEPVVTAFNPHDYPVPLIVSSIGEPAQSRTLVVPARSHFVESLSAKQLVKRGVFKIEQPTQDGLVIGTFVAGPKLLQPLPMEPLAAPLSSRSFFSLKVLRADDMKHLALQVYDSRTEGEPQDLILSVLAFETGQAIQRTKLVSLPGRLQSLDLGDNFKDLSPDQNYRLRIEASVGAILPSFLWVGAKGQLSSLELFEASEGHSTGTYPLPSLSRRDAQITLVNLSPLSTEIAGQVTWEDGAYALGPYHLSGSGALELDFREVAEAAEPDLLDRVLPVDLKSAFLQWSVRDGSRNLVARVEHRDDERSLGFNCMNCCPEMPFGELLPSSIAFDLGQNPTFETIEYVTTCSGSMGPFLVTPDSLSYSAPLTWDGRTISTSGLTHQTTSFSARREGLRLDCRSISVDIFDSGDVTVDQCQKQNNPDHDPTQGCFQQSSNCSSCFDCCEAEKDVALCRCEEIGNPPSCRNLVPPACQKCKERCVGRFLESCSGSLACSL